MNNMYIEYDDAMGMWAVLTDDDRLIRYFPTEYDAETFILFLNAVGE